MRFCIHRGTQEIGGTCVEIESQGKRLVLGFDEPDPSLLGVVISHSHADHYGLADRDTLYGA